MLAYDKEVVKRNFGPIISDKKKREMQTLKRSLDPDFKKKLLEDEWIQAMTDRETELKKKKRKILWDKPKPNHP